MEGLQIFIGQVLRGRQRTLLLIERFHPGKAQCLTWFVTFLAIAALAGSALALDDGDGDGDGNGNNDGAITSFDTDMLDSYQDYDMIIDNVAVWVIPSRSLRTRWFHKRGL